MESGGALQSELLIGLEQRRLSAWESRSAYMKSGLLGFLPLKNEEMGQIFQSMQKFCNRAGNRLEK